MNDRQLRNFAIGLGLGISGFTLAAVSLPNSFTAGTPIKSADVNANFSALKTALETASGINDGALGVGKLNVSGTAADGKVLKLSSGALSWGDDLTGGSGGTTYTAGAGLALTGTTFSVKLPYEGEITSADSSPVGLLVTSRDSSKIVIMGRGGRYGVVGDTISAGGVGVLAANSTGGTALEVSGAIKPSGSNAPAFVHTSTASNSSGNITCLDHPLTNGKPNAIVMVTHNYNPNGASALSGEYLNKAIGVFYTGTTNTPNNRWCVYTEDNTFAVPANVDFNVLVFNP